MPSHRASLRWPGSSTFFEAEEGQGFDVKVDWVGFDEEESLWEPLATMQDGAPQFVNL